MRMPTVFKAIIQFNTVSSQMPQCTHLPLKRIPTRTRTLPACPLMWATAVRWWMVSCMCTQRGAFWKSEIYVMNPLLHTCFFLSVRWCLFLDAFHTFHWQQKSPLIVMLLIGAQSWTCRTQTCESISLIWTSWWPSLSTDQCKLRLWMGFIYTLSCCAFYLHYRQKKDL